MTTNEAATARTLYQDASHETYTCDGDHCGYTGDTYCQNCGYSA